MDAVFVIFFLLLGLMVFGFVVLYMMMVCAGARMIFGIVKDEVVRNKPEPPEPLTERNTLLRPSAPPNTLLRPAGR